MVLILIFAEVLGLYGLVHFLRHGDMLALCVICALYGH
jgi:hypothetical protein